MNDSNENYMDIKESDQLQMDMQDNLEIGKDIEDQQIQNHDQSNEIQLLYDQNQYGSFAAQNNQNLSSEKNITDDQQEDSNQEVGNSQQDNRLDESQQIDIQLYEVNLIDSGND